MKSMDSGIIIDKSETEEGIVTVYDSGLVISSIKEGAYLEVPYLIKGKERLLRLGYKGKFYVLSEGVGFYRISRAARLLSASSEYSEHIAATAVVTAHVSTKLILDLYLKIDKPKTPTKPFMDRNQALRWLEERKFQDEKTKPIVR
jgi:hypothetical protein